jgi:Lacto-N-biose phosphorylase central domain
MFMKMLLKACTLSVLICSSILASAQTVTLDYFFNRETRKNKQGKEDRFHYLWNEQAMSGFSIFGNVFKKEGFKLDSLETAPTLANLKGSDVYLIVDPDRPKENPKPNYIEADHIAAISTWVKQGGVLVMFANDSANVELPHFNKLADVFGMHFTNEMQNHVIDDAHFEDGGIVIRNNPVFKTAKKIFMKDVCSIDTKNAAKPVLKNASGATVIATTKFGKGNVIAIADPWLYDEYVNGRLPKEMGFENDKAAVDLVKWLKTLTRK